MPARAAAGPPQRELLIAGNWKMHKDHLEAIQLVQRLVYQLDREDFEGQEVVVCPPATALRSIQTLIDADRLELRLGAQSCHWEDEGAFTGEVSPRMLARLDVRYVICGHSERRALFGETDEVVSRKAQAVLGHAMRPIVCVGETLEQREAGAARSVVVGQLTGSLVGVAPPTPQDLVVAYEPVWAIGTGRNATPEDAQDMCATVRETLVDVYDRSTADAVRVLYGGSVKPGNVKPLLSQADVDGALVGGASTSAEDFALIVGHRR